jgi:hypothetical protein
VTAVTAPTVLVVDDEPGGLLNRMLADRRGMLLAQSSLIKAGRCSP